MSVNTSIQYIIISNILFYILPHTFPRMSLNTSTQFIVIPNIFSKSVFISTIDILLPKYLKVDTCSMISPSITIFTLLYSRPTKAIDFVLSLEIFILYVFITLSRSVVFNLFCSRTPRYNFSSTLYPQSCWYIMQVIHIV
jgi:hypothetical protein